MGVIKKFNPETGQWEIYGSTDARDINLLDVGDNFSDKTVEGALREISDKLEVTAANLKAHKATLVEHTSNIAWLKENGGGGGGGGGSASAPTITSTFEDNTIVQKEEDVKIPIFFTSPNLGEGIAYIIIDGIEVDMITVKQGNNTINIGQLTNLKNNVAVYVKDRTGMLSNQLSWTIIAGGIDLEIDFDDTADYYITDIVMMQFNVSSASNEPIIMHMTIDYDEFEVECDSGFNEYIFPEMGIGIHKISFYITSGPYSTSIKNYNIVIVSSNSLYVSSTFKGGDFTLGAPIPIQYRISKASKEEFTVNLYLNNRLIKTSICQPGSYYWTLNDLDVDTYKVKIEVLGQYDEPQKLELEFNVVASGYIPLKVIETGLQYRLNARGRTNQDSDKESPIDDSGNGIVTTLHNFNFYTNGWIDNELVCDGGAYVEIDFKPWENNAIYGSTIEIQYTALDIGLTDARIFDYTDINTPYKGAYIDVEESTLSSLAQPGQVSLDKDVETTVSFVIDRRNKFGKIYIDGICSRAFYLSDSGSGVNAEREDFSHNEKIYINSKKGLSNFGVCKIKDIRVYGRVLSDDEIVQNYIAQERDIEKQEKLYNFNYDNNTLPVIRMYGDMTNMTLETPVTMRIKYTSPNEDLYGQSFDLPYCQVNWQGTSSLQYVLKNFTARLKDENMAVYEYSPYVNGIKEDVYCFKADYMESTHSRNVGIAKFVNECLYDTKNPMQLQDANIRNSVNGFPCIMYINDELQGVYNFNLDRYSTKSFGYTNEDKCLVYEVSANSDTTAGAFHKWTEGSGKDELSYYKSDFECLYPPTRAAGNDNMSELIRLIKWVNDSSDEDFKDNFGNYFNKEYVLRYYLFVLVFGAVDSLGKNMKLATWDGLIWYPQVYDADTTIGLDNTGFLKFDMDIEMGDENTFNTTGSKLWQRIVLLFQDELKAEYSLMRQDRFTVDNIMKYLYGEQISQIPATFYNKDMQTKYLNFGSAYLYALHGSGEKHIKKWIRERIMYCDTLLGYMTSSSDYITLRSSKLGEVYLDIETYIPMYVSVKWRDEANNTGLQTKRVGRGETVRFSYNMPTATDQEIIVYAGYYLKRLGNVSNLQPTTMLIANASRLTEIECHSPNLINTDLSQCTKLQRIDLKNCTALGTGIGAQSTLNIQNCKYLRYCDCRNTKLTAIYTMQAGGNLEEIYFPDTTQTVQVTNQTYLKVLGLPYGNLYCKNLASVEISNCHKIEALHYPYVTGDNLTFEPLRYVQNLILSNSIDKVESVQFSGFDKLERLELSSMHHIKNLGFNDMIYAVDDPSLAQVKISDCPLIDIVTFNVSDIDHKIHFVDDAVIDLSGLQSITRIEANTPLIGLKTLIVPNSIKDIIFNYKYESGDKSTVQNIWSGLVNHSNDGFKGIDLLGITLRHITMDAFKNIDKAINMHIAPIDIAPKFNNDRDNNMYPYIKPEGSIDLSKYIGPMHNMFKGMDLSKLDVIISGNRPQEDLTGLFKEAIVSSNDSISGKNKANGILNCYPFADVWDSLFEKATLDFETNDIVFPRDKYISTAAMFRGSNISDDLDMTPNFICVDNMFRDCKNLKTYIKNWEKENYFDIEMTTGGCYFNSGGDLELVPPEWGGYGFYPETTSEIIVNIPYDNYKLELCHSSNKLSIGVVNWGDGEITFLQEDNYVHTYKNPGTYTIKGHFTFGNAHTPSVSLSQVLTRVNYLAQDTKNLNQAFKYCQYLRYVDIKSLKINNLADAFYGCKSLETIFFTGSTFEGLSNMKSAFNGCSNLRSLDLTSINTSDVTDMSYLFNGCSNLSELIINNWNTTYVTNMRNMFAECAQLTSLDLSHFDTSLVMYMDEMFRGCTQLVNLVVDNWDTRNVVSLSSLFDNCKSLSVLEINHFNTDKVTDMESMFNGCEKLVELNVTNFNTSKVTTMAKMFQRCTSLQYLDISNFDTSMVTSIVYMFTGCSYLETLVLGVKNFKKIKDVRYLFSGCSKLLSVDFSQVQFEDVENFTAMFINCNKITSLNLIGFSTSNATSMKNMFSGCTELVSLDLSMFDTSIVDSMEGMFNFCTNLVDLNISSFNTSNVTSMKDMFKNCRGLTNINTFNFDTRAVMNMENMFNECTSLQSLDISHFYDSSLINAKSMFRNCRALTNLNLGTLTFSKVNSFEDMFNGCRSLTEIDLTYVDTRSATSIKRMFYDCQLLSNIIFGTKFTTNSVQDMNSAFSGCRSLTNLDLSNFNTANVIDMGYMFEGASCNVDLSGKNTTKVQTMTRMFKDFKGSSINMSGCDISNSNDNINFIYNTTTLTDFIPPTNISSSITVSANRLPIEVIEAVIDNLASVANTQTLTVGSVILNNLSDEQISKAVIKNWSIA